MAQLDYDFTKEHYLQVCTQGFLNLIYFGAAHYYYFLCVCMYTFTTDPTHIIKRTPEMTVVSNACGHRLKEKVDGDEDEKEGTILLHFILFQKSYQHGLTHFKIL